MSKLSGKTSGLLLRLWFGLCSVNDFTVLNYEPHKFKCLIKESLLITKDKPLFNNQVKSLTLEFF